MEPARSLNPDLHCVTQLYIKAVKQFTKLFLIYTNKSENKIVPKKTVSCYIEELLEKLNKTLKLKNSPIYIVMDTNTSRQMGKNIHLYYI